MDAIHLEDLAFFAYHGVHEEEARLGQRFHIDLSCYLDLDPAGRKDEIALTVNYAELVGVVEEVVTRTRFRLIERLAGAVAERVLAFDPRIERVRVRVHKPGAPLPIATGRVSVEVDRQRGG
ncbi:dihydroneopterin aldolase [Acuticoccus mangrovi]|uniref:7,8-dihydroneopterin aldolase n=1 Tax=Acuticoccus mangrovi TaxID=2796142 RepID=A0A934IIV8_9HYPH|nr:dihydroneopterin aldolase [Acuticoccus mangrovi]MBJ3775801.1 dihydroneopterin aldolase [Acuticoccus mangrovi]